MKKTIDNFIKEHTHVKYCEAIIHKDGLIEYATPSHVEALIRITGEDRKVIYDKMPIWESPINWLVDYTGCVSVWFEGHIKPQNITKDQEVSLNKLIESKLIRDIQFK